MKGLILSGGAGTRLRPITHTSAKQLVPIANKPILFYGIEAMARAGIREIGIIVGSTREEIKSAVGDGSQFGVKVTYIPQDEPLGLAHCVLIADKFLGEDDFIMYLGDNMLEQGLEEFVTEFETARASSSSDKPAAQILLCHVEDPRQFGVAEVDKHGHVVRLVEKPKDPPSDLALVGVYLFDKTINKAVRSIAPSPRGELEITTLNEHYLKAGALTVTVLERGTAWLDTGTFRSLQDAGEFVRVIEDRTGTKVGCVEEIAWRNGWITTGEMIAVAEPLLKSGYGDYLMRLATH